MIIKLYKYRLATNKKLCNRTIRRIGKLYTYNQQLSQLLKNVNTLSSQHTQQQKQIQKQIKKKTLDLKQKFPDYNTELNKNLTKFIKLFDITTLNLIKIIYDMQTILYREARYIKLLEKQLKNLSLPDKQQELLLKQKISYVIQKLKEKMKTVLHHIHTSIKNLHTGTLTPAKIESKFSISSDIRLFNQIRNFAREVRNIDSEISKKEVTIGSVKTIADAVLKIFENLGQVTRNSKIALSRIEENFKAAQSLSNNPKPFTSSLKQYKRRIEKLAKQAKYELNQLSTNSLEFKKV